MATGGPHGGLAADPGAVLDQLDDALDALRDVPLSCLGAEQRRDWLVRLQRLRARLDAVTCISLGEVRSFATDVSATGRRSLGDAVAVAARVDRRSVAADEHLALWLRGYDAFTEAFLAGWLTRAHLAVVRQLDNRRTRLHLAEAQDYLVEAARSLSFPEFSQACRYWALAFDPDGAEPEEQVARRQLNWRKTSDGMVTGRFTLDPVAGHAFVAAVDQQAQRLFHEDTAADDALERTATQRRADALVELITRGAGAGGVAARPGALVHVVMSEAVAEDLLHRAAGAHGAGGGVANRLPLRHGDIDGRCELIDGTPLHPRFVLALLTIATFRRMVFGPGSEITDLGRTSRGFPRRLKEALAVRARGRCQSPGCDAPFSWLQADHLIPWTRHGPTSLANGQLLCHPHNKAKGDGDEPQLVE